MTNSSIYIAPYCERDQCTNCFDEGCNCKCHVWLKKYHENRRKKLGTSMDITPIKFFNKPITFKQPVSEISTTSYVVPKPSGKNKEDEGHTPFGNRGKRK